MARPPARRARRSAVIAVAGVVTMAGGLAACGGESPITASRAPGLTAPATAPSTPAPTMPPITSPTTTAPSPGTTAPGPTSPSTSAPINATAVLHRALADARAEGWVTSDSADGGGTEAIDTVAGPDRGLQTVIEEGQTGHIVVVPGTTYIHGTADALVALFSLPAAQAKILADRWVSLRPGDKQYHSTTEGVTLPSLLAPLALTGHVSGGTITGSDGKHYDLITGRVPKGTGYGNGTETGRLAVTPGSHPLPYEFEIISSKGVIEWAYRDWGKKAAVAVPPGAVPLPH